MNLNGSVMLVTGGAHRVGKAICLALAAEKAHIALTYSSSGEAARITVSELQAMGVQALALQCDQSDPAQVQRTWEAALDRFGRVDGLVNSASIMQEKPFSEITPADWDATLAINTRGPFLFTQLAGQWMAAHHGGAVVNILDESAFVPSRNYVHHSVSKAGLWMLTRSAALALAPRVRVNAVMPGPVLIPEGGDEARWQRLADATPLKRLGTPEEVARVVVFLMKEDFITGQAIRLDGGRTLAK
jgi:pteridine reductase